MEDINELEKQLIAAKAIAKRIELKNKMGEEININDCYIDINNIKGLDKFLEENDMLNEKINTQKISDRYVIPVTLPSGEKIDIEVQNLPNDIKAEMEMFEDGTSELLIKDEIEKNISDNLKVIIDPKQYKEAFLPDDFEKLAEKISDDDLIPENDKDAARILGIGSGERKEKEQSEDKELNKEDSLVKEKNEENDENKENEEEQDIDIDELPDEEKEIISKIYDQDEELKKSGRLKQVVNVVNPDSITEKVSNTGITKDGGDVKLYRFSGDTFSDKVVAVQNDKILTNTKNDRDLSNLMRDVRSNEVQDLDDKDSKVTYEDLDGNKITEDLVKKPTDLTMDKKREFEKKLYEIDNKANSIKNDDDLTPEDKVIMYQNINKDRLDLFKDYGITLPEIEDEVKADSQKVEEEFDEIEETEEIDGNSYLSKEDNDDGWDPRDNPNLFGGGRTRF